IGRGRLPPGGHSSGTMGPPAAPAGSPGALPQNPGCRVRQRPSDGAPVEKVSRSARDRPGCFGRNARAGSKESAAFSAPSQTRRGRSAYCEAGAEVRACFQQRRVSLDPRSHAPLPKHPSLARPRRVARSPIRRSRESPPDCHADASPVKAFFVPAPFSGFPEAAKLRRPFRHADAAPRDRVSGDSGPPAQGPHPLLYAVQLQRFCQKRNSRSRPLAAAHDGPEGGLRGVVSRAVRKNVRASVPSGLRKVDDLGKAREEGIQEFKNSRIQEFRIEARQWDCLLVTRSWILEFLDSWIPASTAVR